MKTNYIKAAIISCLMWAPIFVLAQDTPTADEAPSAEVVKGTFENNLHINNQTVQTHDKGYLEFLIQHRFGTIDKASDMWGLYAPSNIRMYFGYGVTRDLSVGFGATKTKQLYDFSWKYAILRQKTIGMPISLTYSGNLGIRGGDKDGFKNSTNEYKATNRFSYYHELLLARKITKKISLQGGINYAHYNLVDKATLKDMHDFIGMSVIGRYKFSPQGSFMVEFDKPLNVSGVAEASRPLPNLGIGVEFSTGYHQFQIFVCNSSGILNQEAKFNNYNDFSDFGVPGYLIGFNMTRQFGFGE
jgi:hypothetical protein